MKTFLLVLSLVLAFGWAKAQDLPDFDFEDDNVPWPGLGSIPHFAMDTAGNLYLAVNGDNEYYETTIRKYEDGQWSTVAKDPYDIFSYLSLFEVAPDGTIYIANSSGKDVSRWNGSGWEIVGTLGENVRVDALAVASDGTPYIAIRDSLHDRKLTVLALEDDTWQTVGNAGFTESEPGLGNVVLAPDGTPFVVYTTHYYGYNTLVMRLDGDTWKMVGDGIVEGAGKPRLAFSMDGIPYLAFSDSLNGYRATVMKLEVGEWQAVGTRGFSAAGAVPDIAVDEDGLPNVAYSDSSLDRRIIVKRSDGANWETVGNAGFSDFNAVGPSILISPSGTPYVAYADMFNLVDEYAYNVRVALLEGDTWESVGNGDLFSGVRSFPSLAAGNDSSLYMAYHYDYWFDPSFEDWQKTKVVRWKNNTLSDVGDIDYFTGIEDFRDNIKIAFAPDQTLYMAYEDSASGYKTSVFRLEDDSWKALGSPIDTHSSFDLDVDSTGRPYLTTHNNVLKLEDGNWDPVSEEGFSEEPALAHTAIDQQGTLYVASYPSVKKLVGSTWEDISGEPLEGRPVFLSMDESNNLYVGINLYHQNDNTFSLKFMKLDDGNWETIGTEIPNVSWSTIVMDPQGNIFVSIKDVEKKTSVITINDSGQETLVDNELLKGHFPYLEVDKRGNLYMVFELDNIVVYKYRQDCTNPTGGGTIAGSQQGCDAFDPEVITSSSSPTGYEGTLEYQWQSSITGAEEGFTNIEHKEATFDPGILTQTTWFRRLAKVSCITGWTDAAESNVVKMTVVPFPGLSCPANDTVLNDTGSMVARKSYRALPEGAPDTLAVYSIDGKEISFPYDFPLGTTTVQVTAHGSCAVDVACSFTVTVRQATGIGELDVQSLSMDIYPNPFTAEMSIAITNPLRKAVSVEIYSISGQKIRTLARAQKEAKISLRWKGEDEQGKQVPAGLYIMKMNGMARQVAKN